MKILNLYAGIGGNRRLWGDQHEIVAVELDDKRARTYQEAFPKDKVVIGDAHKYLLDNYKDFDFIWSSPPCQTHSRVNFFLNAQGVIRYPDMKLWQEVIFLQQFAKCKFCVENVIPYYKPFIPAQKVGRHLFWANFKIPKIEQPKNGIGRMNGENQWQNREAQTVEERNQVNAELGLHILECAQNIYNQNRVISVGLFE